MIQYFTIEENGHSICCKLYGNEGAAARNVVLLCHGFGGSKEQVAGRDFAERLVAERQDFCASAFDWPTHGTDGKQKLTQSDCDAYLGIVCRWMRDNWHPYRLLSTPTFGCY
jgi:alpha-beta hydrolase superfamily lysophospholipase